MGGEKYPEVQGGGSLILAWQVRNKKVLIIGGGEVAAGRILNLLNADAKVTVISPRDGLNDEVAYRIEQNQVEYHDKKFEPSDLDDPAITMVLTAIDEPDASTQIWKLCKEKRIAANIADVPPECDFYFGSVHRDGPLQIMVSTNGNGPKMANIVRRRIASSLPPNIGDAIAKVGMLRKKLRVLVPENDEGPKRMQWMSKVCVSWTLEDLCEMDEEDMEQLLQYYASNQVPDFSQIRLGEKPDEWTFDGSFGWACVDPEFAAICKVSKNQRWVDFQDPKVVKQLTNSLLKHDFGLKLQLPDDRLCPPVPVRWNYIRWIQELLDTTSETYSDRYDPEREVKGLDIGVGASCIYGLLACKTRPRWLMAGIDIDAHSLKHARVNIETNKLADRIHLVQTDPDDPLIPLKQMQCETLDFVMTNPPFYDSMQDMQSSYTNKHAPPSAICTGSENEMICPGGDVGFVTRILDESLRLRDRVQWYTAMLGKMSSLQRIVVKLKENGVSNYAVTCLQAGHRTKRWAVSWSFRDFRPRNDVARHGELVHAVLPSPTAQTIAVPMMSAEWAGNKVDATVKEIDVRWQWRADIFTGFMETKGNVWSRAARRKKKFAGPTEGENADVRMKNGDGAGSDEEDEEEVALAVKIVCKTEEVQLRWLRGNDYVLFTSFCGMMKRALTGKA
ncbi:siroheme synthase middle domains-like protein [Hortaea werneckii]|nr:siroheme synthase middle domains-like protein [Hortaea werneckii]